VRNTHKLNVWLQAHDDRGVVNMTVDSAADQLITAGAGLPALYYNALLLACV